MSNSSNAPKIGKIKLTGTQKEMIAEFVDSDAFKIIKNVIRPQRQIQIGQMTVRTSLTEQELFENRGRLKESDRLIEILEEITDEYTKSQEQDDEEED